MRLVYLLTFFTGSAIAATPDAAGCKDLKAVPRVGQCVILECSSKRTDSAEFAIGERSQKVEGMVSSVKYSCPAPSTLDGISKELVAALRKVGYLIVTQDSNEAGDRVITGRKGEQWVGVEADVDDGVAGYTITSAEAGAARLGAAENCSESGFVSLPKGCVLSECGSRRKDAVEMRANAASQVSLEGALRTTGIACDASVTPAQLFDAAHSSLKQAGFEVVYSERNRPEYSWLTSRAGKRWIELMSYQDSDAIAYQLTDVQAESVKLPEEPANAVAHSPARAPVLEKPAPAPAPESPAAAPAPPAVASAPPPDAEPRPQETPPAPPPVEKAVAEPPAAPPAAPGPAEPEPAPVSMVAKPSGPVAAPTPPLVPGMTPPRPSRRIALVVPDELQQAVKQPVTVNLLVDVDDRGLVLRAQLAEGSSSPDALKILDAAIAMMMQWRFNPARHNGHRVPGQVVVPVPFYPASSN